MAMEFDYFNVLQAEFDTLSKRFTETKEPAERQVILKQLNKIIRDIDGLLGIRQIEVQSAKDKLRSLLESSETQD